MFAWALMLTTVGCHAPSQDSSDSSLVPDSGAISLRDAAANNTLAADRVITTRYASTGAIKAYGSFAGAALHEEAWVVTTQHCVAHVKSAGQKAGNFTNGPIRFDSAALGASPAKLLWVGGLVGHIYPKGAFFPSDAPPLYAARAGATIGVRMDASTKFPGFAREELRSPAAKLNVLEPVLGQGRLAPVPLLASNADFRVRWAGGEPAQDATISIQSLGRQHGPVADVWCVFPASSGVGTLPKELLRALSPRLTGEGRIRGLVEVIGGSTRVISERQSSYVLVATDKDNGSDFPGGVVAYFTQ